MEPDTNPIVLNWCKENGWEEPQWVNGSWWAIAPHCFIPQPIPPMAYSLKIGMDLGAVQEAIARLSAIPGSLNQILDSYRVATRLPSIEPREMDRSIPWRLPRESFSDIVNERQAELVIAEVHAAVDNFSQALDSLHCYFGKMSLSIPDSMQEADPGSEPELSLAEQIKKRDAANQARMRGFLRNKVAASRNPPRWKY